MRRRDHLRAGGIFRIANRFIGRGHVPVGVRDSSVRPPPARNT